MWHHLLLGSTRDTHSNSQEVLLGYSDTGKEGCRVSVAWALHKCQEKLVDLAKKEGVRLTVMHGRGGYMNRGGGAPLWAAIRSLPPGTINGHLRMIEQVTQSDILWEIGYRVGRNGSSKVRNGGGGCISAGDQCQCYYSGDTASFFSASESKMEAVDGIAEFRVQEGVSVYCQQTKI